MRLLLDTHIWLWSLQDSKQLGRRLQRELRNPMNELWLSPVSTWEALGWHEKGKVKLDGDLDRWVVNATGPFQEAPVTHEIVTVARKLRLSQRDAVDRLLAATAQVLELTLVTADAGCWGWERFRRWEIGEVSASLSDRR